MPILLHILIYFRNLMVLIQIYLEVKVKDLIFLMKILGWILGLPSIQIQIIGLGNNYYVKDSYTLY